MGRTNQIRKIFQRQKKESRHQKKNTEIGISMQRITTYHAVATRR